MVSSPSLECVCAFYRPQLASEVAGFGFRSARQRVNVEPSRSTKGEKSGVATVFVMCVCVCVPAVILAFK